ncbi:MAG: ATP-binding protein, partial [Silvibacterium sp.]|nr:ATP-binding protein [Silvibacterium sp.]
MLPVLASSLEIDSAIAHLRAPYVGLRPCERTEKAIFFGRELDANYLKDKIFSARLTLLYAPSGVGKSSILRTLVTPALEEQHAWVRYFD